MSDGSPSKPAPRTARPAPGKPAGPRPAPLLAGPGGSGRSPYPESVERLIVEFASMPGIGRRSAERMALHVLRADEPDALRLARAIEGVKQSVRPCSVCCNLTEKDPCPICSDNRRDRATILVVEQPRDLIALEQTGMYRGVYHVLMGRLSPLDGVGPEHLTLDALEKRVSSPKSNIGGVGVREVVLGLNPTIEGDGTALYIAERLKRAGVTLSRLARGVPTGGQLEHANKAVLADAIEGRRAME